MQKYPFKFYREHPDVTRRIYNGTIMRGWVRYDYRNVMNDIDWNITDTHAPKYTGVVVFSRHMYNFFVEANIKREEDCFALFYTRFIEGGGMDMNFLETPLSWSGTLNY